MIKKELPNGSSFFYPIKWLVVRKWFHAIRTNYRGYNYCANN